MLLNAVNRCYWYIGAILFLCFSVSALQNSAFLYIHIVSFITFFIYGIILYNTAKQPCFFFTRRNLSIIVFSCSIIDSTILKLLSFAVDGDFFIFSQKDAVLYYTISMNVLGMGYIESIKYLFSTFAFDDLGMLLWTSSIFRIIPSLHFLNLSHCIVGTFSALMIFNISRYFMPRRYAFMASLAFSAASFTVMRQAMCLKETVMIFLIIASFHSFYLQLHTKKTGYILLTILCVYGIFMFRTPTALLLIVSFGLTYLLLYTKGVAATILGTFILVLIGSTSLFAYTYDRYLRGGDTELIMERKNDLSRGGGVINQLADPVAAFAGPFPSVKVVAKKQTPLYASGLLYRFLLFVPFFAGVYYIFKSQHLKMYPVALFFLMNALGLVASVKGLETRLSMPHLAMMYIVAFWFLAKYDYNRFSWKISPKVLYGYFIAMLGLCLLWNLR